jgi:hypothetical protein
LWAHRPTPNRNRSRIRLNGTPSSHIRISPITVSFS